MSPSPIATATASAGWYSATIASFLDTETIAVIGVLATASPFADTVEQKRAWQIEIDLLHRVVQGLHGWIILEFDIPESGRNAA